MNNSSTMFHSPKTRRVAQIERLGFFFLRFGLVIAIGWIAAMKVKEYEAKGIEPLIAHIPLLSWGYSICTVHHFTEIIGSVDMTSASLIPPPHSFPKASASAR